MHRERKSHDQLPRRFCRYVNYIIQHVLFGLHVGIMALTYGAIYIFKLFHDKVSDLEEEVKLHWRHVFHLSLNLTSSWSWSNLNVAA